MATVVVVNADRTLEIEATSIISGGINEAGHLILTRHDGTDLDFGAVSGMRGYNGTNYEKVDAFSYIGPVDPGAVPDGSVWYDTDDVSGPFASESTKGLVQLATTSEVQAGVNNAKAVSPASLASTPGVRNLSGITESASVDAYPTGVSFMSLSSGSGWSLNSGFGGVVTNKISVNRCQQIFFTSSGGTSTPLSWMRTYNPSDGGGGWTAWTQYSTLLSPTPSNYVQTTALIAYPKGYSRLYYTTSSSSGWDFAGKSGEVLTYTEGTDFAKQIWTEHAKGSTGVPEVWIRTANSASGWTPWKKFLTDFGEWKSWTPIWSSTSGSNLPVYGNAAVDCRYVKVGRRVECRFEIQFGTMTTYGAAGAADNWEFSLPVAAARTTDHIGFVQLQQSNAKTCMGAVRTVSPITVRIGVASGFVDGTAATNTGDIDSSTPAVWASGNAIRGTFSYESAT